MDIYIVCTDVSLFCDTNDTTHAIAASKLVDRVSPYFASSQIKSIQVIMAMSGLLELQHGASTQNREDTDIGSDVQVDNNGTNHRTSMSKCVRAIEYVFEKNEFAPNSMLDSAFGRGGNFVSVRFSVVSNSSIGFKSLSRQWIRNCLIELQPSCRINFDLPPTVDGTQCSVELDAAYQIFPFPIDSPQATMMTSDLQAISKLILSVIQLVPLATLDVSLFYGIPIKVGTALGIDCSQFQEMQVLVRTLFQSLQERESALVLRGIPHRTHGVVRSNKSAGIFQSTSEQLFVLLAQETPGSNSATSGVLHRIAHADHLVTEASVSADHAMDFSDSTMEAQYTEYIEASFSATAMRPFNPLDYASLYSLPPCDKTTVDTTEVKKSPEMQNPIVSPTETQSGSEGSGYLSISSRTEQETVNADESIGLGRDRMAANTVSLSPKKGMSSVWNDSAGIGACGPQSSMEAHCILENDDDDGDVSMFDADY